jgi:hypothetical protein
MLCTARGLLESLDIEREIDAISLLFFDMLLRRFAVQATPENTYLAQVRAFRRAYLNPYDPTDEANEAYPAKIAEMDCCCSCKKGDDPEVEGDPSRPGLQSGATGFEPVRRYLYWYDSRASYWQDPEALRWELRNCPGGIEPDEFSKLLIAVSIIEGRVRGYRDYEPAATEQAPVVSGASFAKPATPKPPASEIEQTLSKLKHMMDWAMDGDRTKPPPAHLETSEP